MPQNPTKSTLFVSKIVSANADIVVSPAGGTGVVTLTAAGDIYNPAAVAITGGTIDGAAVGGTTPAAGAFTTLTSTSPPTISGAAITAATIPNTSLAANGGLAAIIGAGLGASANYAKTTSGAQTLLASTVGARAVLITVVVNQTFANGDGAQPTFQIGQTGTANKFADTSAFTGATAGTVLNYAGTLTGSDNLIVTGVAGTGTTETGGLSVTVLALPSA